MWGLSSPESIKNKNKMLSGIWRKAKKKNMKKERKFGLKEFSRPLISWNGGASKYDIRDWAPQHEKMGKGITYFRRIELDGDFIEKGRRQGNIL